MLEQMQYLENNECFKVGKKLQHIKGVLVHSTATPGVNAKSFADRWNTLRPAGRQVCVHAFIDDKVIINTLPYVMRCWGCGSGKNGSGNDMYIQIEMCEPKEIYYTSGWNYNSRDIQSTREYIDKMVDGLVEFIVNRLIELGISEINKETVTSHYEAHLNGIASNHGDPAGLLGLAGYDMDIIRDMCKDRLDLYIKDKEQNDKNNENANGLTRIDGLGLCSRNKMINFIRKHNGNIANADSLVDTYISEGNRENIRFDVAFAQSILETGYFKFIGSAVEFGDYNFAGLGVTQNGKKGNIYPDMTTGVRAQIQHLKAYANAEPLRADCVDVRFKYVKRGCAPYVEWLGQKENPHGLGWATGKDYGSKILNILNSMFNTSDDSSFLVKVTDAALNIREKPTKNSKKKGVITDFGVYTIVEVNGNWGRLKSGAGWIHLGYTKRL